MTDIPQDLYLDSEGKPRSFTVDFIPINVHFAERVIAYLDECPKAKRAFLEALDFAYSDDDNYNAPSTLGEFSISFRQFLCPDCPDKAFTGVMMCVCNMLLEGRWF